jgi:uncharacterized RDD family membrane protein YckC
MVERDLSEHIPDAQNWAPAPLSRRFGALLVDWIICLLIAALYADPRHVGWPPVVILILAYGLFLGLFGQTPGMFVTRLRCLSFDTGRPIGIPRALLRGLLLAVLVPALIMDGDRRGLHDRWTGSVVVSAL